MENKTGFDVELEALKTAIRKQLNVLSEQLDSDTARLQKYKEEKGDYFYRTDDGRVTDVQLVPHIERCRLSIKSALESVANIIKIEKEAKEKDSGNNKPSKPFDARAAFDTPKPD